MTKLLRICCTELEEGRVLTPYVLDLADDLDCGKLFLMLANGAFERVRIDGESSDALEVVRGALESAAVPLDEVPIAYRGAATGCRAYSQFEGSLLLLAEEPDSRPFEVVGHEKS